MKILEEEICICGIKIEDLIASGQIYVVIFFGMFKIGERRVPGRIGTCCVHESFFLAVSLFDKVTIWQQHHSLD